VSPQAIAANPADAKIRNFPIAYNRLFGIRERCILIPPD
jgi:hypothetical protein